MARKKKIPKVFKYVELEEMNEVLRNAKDLYFIQWRAKEDEEPFKEYAFIEDLRVNVKVTLRYKGKPVTFQFNKANGKVDQRISGVESYRILCQYCRKTGEVDNSLHHVAHPDRIGSAKPLLYYNKDYEGIRVPEAYGYDVNSAYSWAMLQDMPETRKVVGRERIVKKGEIGFYERGAGDNNLQDLQTNRDELIMADVGEYAEIIFKRIESPFKKFVYTWYNKKKKAPSGSAERTKAKEILNYSVGYLQHVNPYIRATIITRVNTRIGSLIDKNTVFCNTDSIVSAVRRPDIEANIGEEIGQWKLEHCDSFAYLGFNYQRGKTRPKYRGVAKAWFKEDYDILTDPTPTEGNIYYLDHKNLIIKEIEENGEER